MIFVVSILFLLTSIFAAVSNRDIFTPGKLYLVFFLAFHVGALFMETTILTGVFMLVVLAVGMYMVLLEAGVEQKLRIAGPGTIALRTERSRIDYSWALWLASTPAIFAQLYMIQHFGGLDGYIYSISLRVIEWAGFGWARTLITLITPVNMVYFAIGCIQRRPPSWWAVYGLHFSILVAMALLSGSRSTLLNVFIFQIVIFHYLVRRVQPQIAILLGVALVMSAMTLGVLRNIVRVQDGALMTLDSTSQGTTAIASFTYGVDPLEVIARTEYPVRAYGSTFLSVVTNIVPRNLWPDKPASGGVFFTRNYMGDIWEGYSNVTPTFLGEWIINFGPALGVLGFFLSYGWISLGLHRSYQRVTAAAAVSRLDVTAIDLVIYLATLLGMIGLIVGETTNVILTLLTSQLIPLWTLRIFIKWRSAR